MTRPANPITPAAALAARPFLKAVGGKAWMCRSHAHLLPPRAEVQRLGLPFCGGAAMAFHYAGAPMLLSDTNPHLMTAFVAVRDHREELQAELAAIEERGYRREHYDAVVELLNTAHTAPLARRAAWVFVVSFWGFNGLWRVNQKGEINVPFGKPSGDKVPRLFDAENLRACSAALAQACFAVLDFEEQLRRMQPRAGDFIYLDSPFVASSATANFVGYGAKGFGPADQERLAAVLPELDRAGVRWALSQSETPEARKLFCQPRPGWNVARLKRTGTINSAADKRDAVGEILVRNYR